MKATLYFKKSLECPWEMFYDPTLDYISGLGITLFSSLEHVLDDIGVNTIVVNISSMYRFGYNKVNVAYDKFAPQCNVNINNNIYRFIICYDELNNLFGRIPKTFYFKIIESKS